MEMSGLKRLQEKLSGMASLPFSEEPIFLLGKAYHVDSEAEEELSKRTALIAEDLYSRVWVTYRNDFEPIGQSGLTSDAGWGCTIRSGQMLLANTLMIHSLGRDWRRTTASASAPVQDGLVQVISLFSDKSSREHYLSIHRIVSSGHPFGIRVGHWVGPYVLCQTVKSILDAEPSCPFRCYLVSEPGGIPTLYHARAHTQEPSARTSSGGEEAEGTSGSTGTGNGRDSRPWSPLVILVPVTLGATPSINPCYVPQMLEILSMPESIGIVGGRPGSSLYLIGRQGDRVFYLDPHTLQAAGNPCIPEVASTYFCDALQHMLASKLDPSLALGFYCRSEEDFEGLYAKLDALQQAYPSSPLVSVARDVPDKQPQLYDISTAADPNDESWEAIQ
mmetsp:Transcript_1077/g.2521  ORF Transcript_1077/g.2521 Transcript_1077/m.2521 type:complete len:390 (+) Transcript_1077:406-1575(+)